MSQSLTRQNIWKQTLSSLDQKFQLRRYWKLHCMCPSDEDSDLVVICQVWSGTFFSSGEGPDPVIFGRPDPVSDPVHQIKSKLMPPVYCLNILTYINIPRLTQKTRMGASKTKNSPLLFLFLARTLYLQGSRRNKFQSFQMDIKVNFVLLFFSEFLNPLLK